MKFKNKYIKNMMVCEEESLRGGSSVRKQIGKIVRLPRPYPKPKFPLPFPIPYPKPKFPWPFPIPYPSPTFPFIKHL